MSTHYHALVWLDHRVAKIFHFNIDQSDRTVINSTQSHEHVDVDKDFLEHVTQAVAKAGAILIVGPGSAKTELHTHIKHLHAPVAAKISAVEPIDHPSDGALLAYGRRFFKADDRMRSQVHG